MCWDVNENNGDKDEDKTTDYQTSLTLKIAKQNFKGEKVDWTMQKSFKSFNSSGHKDHRTFLYIYCIDA